MKSREVVLRLAFWHILSMQEVGTAALSTEEMLASAKKTCGAFTGVKLNQCSQKSIDDMTHWITEAIEFLRSENRH